jgi:hypothetical protein
MTTANDLIQDAMEQGQWYAPGETMSSADAQRGLTTLNAMLDEWSNESLACYCNLEQSVTLIPGQAAYTVGPGGDVNGQRPLNVLIGPGAARITDTNGNQYDVEVITQDRWNIIGAPYSTSDYPDTLFYDAQFPLGIINVFPTPSMAYTLTWDSRLQLSDLSNLTSPFSLPPGYYKAITSCLALDLFPYFAAKGEQPSQLLIAKAFNAKGAVKRTNMREVVAYMDSAIVSRAQGTYNISSDSYNKGGS